MIKLTLIISTTGTHANILIYDKKSNTLERFEPYGIIPYVQSTNLDQFIIDKVCVLFDKPRYLKPIDLFEGIGMQVISSDDQINVRKTGDPAGYCLAWTFWYLEMRINNPDISQKELIKICMDKILSNNKSNDNEIDNDKIFISFIRNYAASLDKAKNEFMRSINIADNNIYNMVLNDDDINKLKKGLVAKFNQINKIKQFD